MAPVPDKKSKTSTLELVVTFALLYVITSFGLKYFFPNQFGSGEAVKPVVVSVQDTTVSEGNDPVVIIKNNTDKALALPERCPQPPVDTAFIGTSPAGETHTDLMAHETAAPCEYPKTIEAKSSATISLAPWKYVLFQERGIYELSLPLPADFADSASGSTLAARFSIVEPGFFTKVFRTFISKPLMNALIFFGTWLPGHNLGLAIILLTILVKLILLVPNQHALEGQKKLQMVQPRMDEIKRKYPNDPKLVQEETVKLWKEMKINPLQSCLPTLLQFPILIGLFYVIRSGAALETSKHLIYSYYSHLTWTFGYSFLGFDLLKPNITILPIMLVVLQFWQMKMMMDIQRKKRADKDGKEIVERPWYKPEMNQQTVMMYVLPLMIGFFALRFPAAVSIYWGISTIFGIAQQWYVIRKKA